MESSWHASGETTGDDEQYADYSYQDTAAYSYQDTTAYGDQDPAAYSYQDPAAYSYQDAAAYSYEDAAAYGYEETAAHSYYQDATAYSDALASNQTYAQGGFQDAYGAYSPDDYAAENQAYHDAAGDYGYAYDENGYPLDQQLAQLDLEPTEYQAHDGGNHHEYDVAPGIYEQAEGYNYDYADNGQLSYSYFNDSVDPSAPMSPFGDASYWQQHGDGRVA
ncbi:hypothetical protein P43SY_011687 [Pythium insidiosum]|uniref:Uncharacterized protein n=1 Tax=Pythium insidiosum TaxID=114742 RepID=A0AAD5Q098_PYTIN|nr:hypothetical protein P43SY_011687 [Pythium insidiosum]